MRGLFAIAFILFFCGLMHATIRPLSNSISYNFSAQSKDSISVYLFLLDDCPICIDYTSSLNAIYDEFGDEINFQGYFPNFTSKKSKIDSFVKKYRIEFPVQSDYFKTQSKKWNVTVTPEVVVYNHTTNTIVYKGRIDNKFVRLGKRRNVVTKRDLKDVLASIHQNITITPYITEPIGCYISYGDKTSPQN